MTTTLLRLSLILGTALAPTNQVHAKQCDVSLDMLTQKSKDFLRLLDGVLPPIKLFPESKHINFGKHKRVYIRALVSDGIDFNESKARTMFYRVAGFAHKGPAIIMKHRAFKKSIFEEVESLLTENISKKISKNGFANLVFVEKNSSTSLPDVFNSTLNLKDCTIHQIRDHHIQFTVVMVPKVAVGSCLVSGIFAHYGVVNLQYLSEINEQVFSDKTLNYGVSRFLNPFLTRMYGNVINRPVDITKDSCNLRWQLMWIDQTLERQFQEFKRAHPEIKLTD